MKASRAMEKRMTFRELGRHSHYHPTLAESWTCPAEDRRPSFLKSYWLFWAQTSVRPFSCPCVCSGAVDAWYCSNCANCAGGKTKRAFFRARLGGKNYCPLDFFHNRRVVGNFRQAELPVARLFSGWPIFWYSFAQHDIRLARTPERLIVSC